MADIAVSPSAAENVSTATTATTVTKRTKRKDKDGDQENLEVTFAVSGETIHISDIEVDEAEEEVTPDSFHEDLVQLKSATCCGGIKYAVYYDTCVFAGYLFFIQSVLLVALAGLVWQLLLMRQLDAYDAASECHRQVWKWVNIFRNFHQNTNNVKIYIPYVKLQTSRHARWMAKNARYRGSDPNTQMRKIWDESVAAYPPSDDPKMHLCAKAVIVWYSQSLYWDFETRKVKQGRDDVDDFLNVVWRNTGRLSVASATNVVANKTYIVANFSPRRYSPATDTQKRANVKPVKCIKNSFKDSLESVQMLTNSTDDDIKTFAEVIVQNTKLLSDWTCQFGEKDTTRYFGL